MIKSQHREVARILAGALRDPPGDLAACQRLMRFAAKHLQELHDDLYNRRNHNGRITAPPTRYIKKKILSLAARHPDMSYQEIAIMLNTSIGRVSEAMHGKRT